MLTTSDLYPGEVVLTATLSSGPGGQNVNKVASAIQLHFDSQASSLPRWVKERLLQLRDHRVSATGVVVLKANRHRQQERNRTEALARLDEILASAQSVRKVRRKTTPSKAAKARRLAGKKQRGNIKKMRGRIRDDQ